MAEEGSRPGAPAVTLGIDRLVKDAGGWGAEGRRIGLLSNDGSGPGTDSHAPGRVALLEAGIPLTHLFSPEHGLSASAPDGAAVPHGTDSLTGLPVTSLYGPQLRPEPGLLSDLDSVLVDLQDVGARFYTYLWTLTHLMEACSEAGIPLVILDRPNPLGGLREWVEGPLPDAESGIKLHIKARPKPQPKLQAKSQTNFLGRWPIPIRHSLTLGEMGLLLQAEMQLKLDLQVVPLDGWRRDMLWRDTGLPFRPPSPGIPSPESALLYPGLAFLEATNVLEGRGTAFSFRWVGAPWMVEEGGAQALADSLNRSGGSGIRARPHHLDLPEKGESCPGVLLDITDPGEVRPVALGLRLLSVLCTLWPTRFSWTPYPATVNPSGSGHLLRLLARSELVETLERAPESLDESTLESWTAAPGWWNRARPHLLYEEGKSDPTDHGLRSHS